MIKGDLACGAAQAAVRAVIAQQRLGHLMENVQQGGATPKSAILLDSADDMKCAPYL